LATFTETFVKITQVLVEGLLQEPCAMIQLLMDESCSMDIVQVMIRDSIDTIVVGPTKTTECSFALLDLQTQTLQRKDVVLDSMRMTTCI
jgi:hypothetical protein